MQSPHISGPQRAGSPTPAPQQGSLDALTLGGSVVPVAPGKEPIVTTALHPTHLISAPPLSSGWVQSLTATLGAEVSSQIGEQLSVIDDSTTDEQIRGRVRQAMALAKTGDGGLAAMATAARNHASVKLRQPIVEFAIVEASKARVRKIAFYCSPLTWITTLAGWAIGGLCGLLVGSPIAGAKLGAQICNVGSWVCGGFIFEAIGQKIGALVGLQTWREKYSDSVMNSFKSGFIQLFGGEAILQADRTRKLRGDKEFLKKYSAVRQELDAEFRKSNGDIDIALVGMVEAEMDKKNVGRTHQLSQISWGEELRAALWELRMEHELRKKIASSSNPYVRRINPRELWRLGIDRCRHEKGKCGFEDELGCLGGYMNGYRKMLERLETPGALNQEDYVDFQSQLVANVRHLDASRGMMPSGLRLPNHVVFFGLTVGGNMTEAGKSELEEKVRNNSDWWEIGPIPPGGQGLIMFAQTSEKLREHLRGLFVTFNENLVALNRNGASEDDKIRCIVAFCQELDQRHYFTDGNVRTSSLALNFLLLQNGLCPTLLKDPNCLDAHSVEELVSLVKEGQDYFRNNMLSPDG